MKSLQGYLDRLDSLPLASSVAAMASSRAILEKLDTPDSSSIGLVEEEIAKLCPEFYAFLFKQAQVQPTENLKADFQCAIDKLGFERTKRLIYFHIAYSKERDAARSELHNAFSSQLWSFNFKMASILDYWGDRIYGWKSDELFYLAMMQNLGISALAQLEPSKHRALRESNRKVPLAQKELEHLGLTHYDISIALVERWKLPTIHQASMRFEQTHGQSCLGVVDEKWEEIFTLLYFAKYRTELSRQKANGAIRQKGIDPYFDYSETLIRLTVDRVLEIKGQLV